MAFSIPLLSFANDGEVAVVVDPSIPFCPRGDQKSALVPPLQRLDADPDELGEVARCIFECHIEYFTACVYILQVSKCNPPRLQRAHASAPKAQTPEAPDGDVDDATA